MANIFTDPLPIIGKDELRTGHILFVHSHAFVSDIIHSVTGSEWNHVGMIVRIKQHLFVIESDFRRNGFMKFLFGAGIVMTSFDDYFLDKYKKYELAIGEDIFAMSYDEDLINFAFPMCGRIGYNYLDLFRQIIRWTVKKATGKDIWIDEKHPARRFTCSKFLSYIFYQAWEKAAVLYYRGIGKENPWKNWQKNAPVDVFNNPVVKKYSLMRTY